MLSYVSGLEEGQEIGRRSKAERKARRSERKKKRKERRKERGSLVAKIAAAPARNAFLGLVRINFLKLADKCHKARTKNQAGLDKTWKKLGGKPDVLNKTIDLGKKIAGVEYDQRVGVAPAVPALLAAATPIIIVMTKFFKESGILDPKEEADLNTAIDDGKTELNSNPEFEKTYTDTELGDNQIGIGKDKQESDDEGGDNTMLFLALGAGALLLLGSKK